MELTQLKCEPCQKGGSQLSQQEIQELAEKTPKWNVQDKQIVREFKFGDFREAMDFVNHVAELAEEEAHHPDIFISYAKVRLMLSTHKVGGLTLNDFILAAKIDRLGLKVGAVLAPGIPR